MDLIQEQVSSLNARVDALYQMLQQVSDTSTEVLSELRGNAAKNAGQNKAAGTMSYPQYGGQGFFDPAMTHKDVLSDSIYPESDGQSGGKTLSPEIQIQRLTAQLTAAYNRIAALEEQLMSQRIHLEHGLASREF